MKYPITRLFTFFLSLTPALAAEKVALVIGNNAYQHGTPLNNCINDARAVSAALKAAGFQVTVVEDAGLEQMEAKTLEFRRAAQGAKAAWFHYSGHGAEVKGANYLIPVDADVKEEFQVKHKAFALDQMLGAMEEAKTPLKVVVLDCCRDNPFGRGWSRTGSKGLGQIENTTEGTIIAYATSPGKVAADGAGQNSPFTTALVSAIKTPGLDVKDIFNETGRQVLLATNKIQQPWINSSFFDRYVLLPGGGAAPAVPLVPSAPAGDDFMLFAGKVAGERKLLEVAPGVSIPFRWCPAGSFTMGSPAAEQALAKKWGVDGADETQHRVTLTQGFWLAETEVTRGQWQAVMKTTLLQQAKRALEDDTVYESLGKKTYRDFVGMKKTYDPSGIAPAQGEQLPMYLVNHEEAEEWCATASREAAVRGWRIALPTEAQWEYACRAGSSEMSYAGDFEIDGKSNAPGLDKIAWYGGNSSQGYSGKGWDMSGWPEKQYPGGMAGPRRVGQKAGNDWGLRDMIGNVYEWNADWYGAYPSGRVDDPQGASTGVSRVIRGGSWNDFAALCRAANRYFYEPGIRGSNLGFRPALVPSK